jgi:hypothetical protein
MAIPSVWRNFITTVYLDIRVVLSAWLWFPMRNSLLFEPVSKESVGHWRRNGRIDAIGLAKLALAVSVCIMPLSHTFYRIFISIIWVCQITRNTILIRCAFRITLSFTTSQLVWSKSVWCYENWQFITVVNASASVKLSSYLSEKLFKIISTVHNRAAYGMCLTSSEVTPSFTRTHLSPFTCFPPLLFAGSATTVWTKAQCVLIYPHPLAPELFFFFNFSTPCI